MSSNPFDRSKIRFRPLAERRSKLRIEDVAVDPDAPPPDARESAAAIDRIAERIRAARQRGAAVVLCHGAHLIRNGLGTVLIRLLEEGWVSHVATNGAGSIHDWEFAHAGKSTEDVRENVAVGEFGTWSETGAYLGLALQVGAVEGLGYGESVGRMIERAEVTVPSREELREQVRLSLEGNLDASAARAAAARLELLADLEATRWPSGRIEIPHPWKAWSVQAASCRLGRPQTVHPCIGQDITFTHPLFSGSAVGRTALKDFLVFVSAIERLEGGVYLSVGSSVMSPMVFEKSLSMARNVSLQAGRSLDDFDIVVNDLAGAEWDWSRGEPPRDHAAYYLRFCKSFSRMGGRFTYIRGDNRMFLRNLYARLR